MVVIVLGTTPFEIHSVWVEPSDGPGNGAAHILDGSEGVMEEMGRTGLGLPPTSFQADAVPNQPGKRLRQTNVDERTILLPLFIFGATPTQFRQRRDMVARWFSPTRGDGVFEVSRPDGTVRQITCRCSRLDWAEDEQNWTPTTQVAVATLVAYDPYWYDLNPTSAVYTLGDPGATFLSSNFFHVGEIDEGMSLSNAQVIAHAQIVNAGDQDAWPVWVFRGPGDNPTLFNVTTGKRLSLISNFIIGQTVTIDTRPGAKSVMDALGTKLARVLSRDSSIFPLVPGTNRVEVQATNATADTSVSVSYYQRWVSA